MQAREEMLLLQAPLPFLFTYSSYLHCVKCSFFIYLMSTCYVPGTWPGFEDSVGNKTDRKHIPWNLLSGEKDKL